MKKNRGSYKRCPECVEIHRTENSIIWYLRKGFFALTYNSPEEAKKLYSEMQAEEGPEFTKLVLNGIPEERLFEEESKDIDG